MIAEILATGDEIRSGALVDSNSGHIARALEETGIEVARHGCVGDNLESIASVLQEIAGRADLAVVTGGLGATEDDLTAAAAAKAAGVELVQDPTALDSLAAFFKARQQPLSAPNHKQALLPAGADCLVNPVGSAPGFQLQIGRCQMFFLPGVPFEMKQILAEAVLPRLAQLQGATRCVRQTRTLSTFGLTEADTAGRLRGFGGRFPGLKLGLRVKFPEIQVKLYGHDADEEGLRYRLDDAGGWVRRRLGGRVFSHTGESLEQAVARLLRARQETLALAESCTGGLMADLITEVPGSSDYFVFSAVTYANQAKVDILAVDVKTLQDHGAVSVETAREMASGVRSACGTTYGLATSGIAGPGGASAGKPVGTVCIGLATSDGVSGHRYHFPYDHRSRNKRIFAAMALELLRRELVGQ